MVAFKRGMSIRNRYLCSTSELVRDHSRVGSMSYNNFGACSARLNGEEFKIARRGDKNIGILIKADAQSLYDATIKRLSHSASYQLDIDNSEDWFIWKSYPFRNKGMWLSASGAVVMNFEYQSSNANVYTKVSSDLPGDLERLLFITGAYLSEMERRRIMIMTMIVFFSFFIFMMVNIAR